MIEANIYLNEEKKINIYQLELEHSLLECMPYNLVKDFEKSIPIFRAVYPITGIINIPVSVDFNVKYGFEFSIVNTRA